MTFDAVRFCLAWVEQPICIAIEPWLILHPAGHQQRLALVSNNSPIRPVQIGISQLILTFSVNSRQASAAQARRLAQAAMQAADSRLQSSAGQSLLQTATSFYPDFNAADTTTSDLTKEGKADKAYQFVAEIIMQLVALCVLIICASTVV